MISDVFAVLVICVVLALVVIGALPYFLIKICIMVWSCATNPRDAQ